MPIGYLCQRIFYAVFAVVSACCVPVSLADVLARSAFRAVCAVLYLPVLPCDFLSYGGTNPDGTTSKPMSKGYMLLFSAVLQNSFHFVVFPKKLITFNPMQYVKLRGRKQETDIFSDSEEDTASIPTITHEQFQKLAEFLRAKDNPALLPMQIA